MPVCFVAPPPFMNVVAIYRVPEIPCMRSSSTRGILHHRLTQCHATPYRKSYPMRIAARVYTLCTHRKICAAGFMLSTPGIRGILQLMATDPHSRGKRQLHVWLKCETYVKLQNLATERDRSMTDIITRLVEKETAGVQITPKQAKEIKRRVEGDPLWAIADMIRHKATRNTPTIYPRRAGK